MTIGTAIKIVDELKPNTYSEVMKVQWLSRLDGFIHREILSTHEDNPLVSEDNPDGSFAGYTADTNQDTELLVPFPYDEDVYNFYLQARIDNANGETNKYNQSISLYNSAITLFQNYWNREHTPLKKGQRFRF